MLEPVAILLTAPVTVLLSVLPTVPTLLARSFNPLLSSAEPCANWLAPDTAPLSPSIAPTICPTPSEICFVPSTNDGTFSFNNPMFELTVLT